MSARAYAHLPELVAIDPPDGGVVRSSGAEVYAPTTILATPTGASFGPLYLGVPSDSVCSLSRLVFLPPEVDASDGWLIFGVGAGAVGAPLAIDEAHHPSLRRREVLGLAGLVLGATVTAASPAAAQSDEDDTVALKIAEFDVDALDGPLEVRVLDVVSEVLPPTTKLLVDNDDAREGELTDPGAGVVLKPGTSETVAVYLQDAKGRLDRLLAWARGAIDRDETIVYARELDQPATDYDEGKLVTLSAHSALVEPVAEAGAHGTTLHLGQTAVPHQSQDGTGEVGSYGVFDDALVYEVGSNPPDSTNWELETRLGLLERTANRVTDRVF